MGSVPGAHPKFANIVEAIERPPTRPELVGYIGLSLILNDLAE